MSKFLFTIVFFVFLLLGTAPLYALNIITLAPNVTRIVQSIIDKAKADDLNPKVNIIATVHYSGEPESIRKIPSVGNAYDLRLEKIVLLKPDLVITWRGINEPLDIEKLRAFNINVDEVGTSSLNTFPGLIIKLGQLIGLKAQAIELASEFSLELYHLKPKKKPNKTIFVQLSEVPLYTIGGQGFMNEIISFCGGVNIYQNIPKLAFEVSTESVILKDPDIILVTQNLLNRIYKPLETTKWQNYSAMSAVKNKQIYAINSNDVSQATLSLIKGVRGICEIINN